MTNKSDTKNEIDMKKRMEPVFWLDNKCPVCGHRSPLIYTPDLLESNIDCECQSKFNPVIRNTQYCAEWSIVIDDVNMLWEEICKNRKPLGYIVRSDTKLIEDLERM